MSAALILAGIATTVAIAVLGSFRDSLLRFVPDDAFYYFEIARRIASGDGSSFDGLTQTNGYHPLWLLLLLPATSLMEHSREAAVRIAMVAQVLMLFLAVWVLYAVGRHLSTRFAFLAALLPASILTFGSHYGVESSLAMLLLAAVLYLAADKTLYHSPSRAFVIGTTAGLLVLARLDAFVFPLSLDLAWAFALLRHSTGERRRSTSARSFAACVAPQIALVVVYLAYNQHNFGYPLPISSVLKVARSAAPSLAWMHSNMSFVGVATGALALITLILYRGRQRPLFLTVAASGTLLSLVAIAARGGQETYHWYFTLPALCSGLFICAICGRDPRFGPLRLAQPYVLFCLCLLLYSFSVGRRLTLPSDFVERYDKAVWIRTHAPLETIFAETDCGILGYISERPFVNMDGLTNSFGFQRAIEEDRVAEWLRRVGVNAMVLPAGAAAALTGDTVWRIHLRRGVSGHQRNVSAELQPWEYGQAAGSFRLWRIRSFTNLSLDRRSGPE